MQVVQIEELDKKRVRIQLEDGCSFPLYKGESRKYGLQEGVELTREQFQEICQETLIKRARKRTMQLLEKMDRTEEQLRTKLKQGFYPEDIIEDVLENIERNGIYVDAKPLDVELPDSKDMMFYEVVMEERSMPSRARGEAACAENSYLVTGNIKHFPVERFIVTPREMMDIILADTEGGNRVIN